MPSLPRRPAFGFLLLLAACAPSPQLLTPVGTWRAELWIDAASPGDSLPTQRLVSGLLTVGDSGRDSTYNWPDTVTKVPLWLGNYQVDLRPFFGTPIAKDVSTTFFGRTDGYFATELIAFLDRQDSLHLELIPRISHGGISATGAMRGDSVLGTWYVRAYAGGATGHFRLTRTSRAAPQVLRDPPPPPPDTLPLAKRGTILVRILDAASGRVLPIGHSLHTDSSLIFRYSTGTTPEGWGPSFWLPPGNYGILIDKIPCGADTHFLEHDFEQRFLAVPGETTYVTVRLPVDSLVLGPSYKNPTRRRCSELRDGH